MVHAARKDDQDRQQRVKQMARQRRLTVVTAAQNKQWKVNHLGNAKPQDKWR